MNKTFWNFPAAIGGTINSINNAGIETFRDNALDSLTREICQNSLDAVKQIENPVVVEFKSFVMNQTAFPKKSELQTVFHQAQATWKGKNKKSEDFIANSIDILNQETINVLRISDFNTKGLEGAKKGELGSPWSSLVKEAGSSNKGEASGGSFGIGKSAPFLNSNLRTLFYSSLDSTGYESHIGVANIMSFRKNDSQITLGSGYFTNDNKSKAIPGQLFLEDSFSRKESGTDIYITAFQPTEEWEQEIVKSVLHNFFITVYHKKLIVKVNDLIINHKNIEQLIVSLDDREENLYLKQYFQLLVSKKTIKIPYPSKKYKKKIIFEEGEMTVYLMKGEELNRRVLMTRKTGMRIFEQNRISGSISFTGIAMITGKNMNSIFKELENPAHNEWSPDRYEQDSKLAKKIFDDVKKFMRETVKQLFQEDVKDSVDAIGLSEFLPNKSLLQDSGVNKTEVLQSKIRHIVTKEKKEEKVKTSNSKVKSESEAEIEEQLLGQYGIDPTGEEGGNGTGEHSEGGNAGAGASESGGMNEINNEIDGEAKKKRERKPSLLPIEIKQKYVCINKQKGIYRIIVSSKKTLANGRLEFTVLGEQSNYGLPILQATTNDSNVLVEKCSSNTIHLQSIKANKSFVVDVEIDYSDYCALEVELYEN